MLGIPTRWPGNKWLLLWKILREPDEKTHFQFRIAAPLCPWHCAHCVAGKRGHWGKGKSAATLRLIGEWLTQQCMDGLLLSGHQQLFTAVFFVVWLVYWIRAFDWIWISFNAKVTKPAGGRLLTKSGPYTHSYLETWITTSLDSYPDMFDRENIIKYDLIDWWEWDGWMPEKTAVETFYVSRKRQKWKVWSYCEYYQWITRWDLADCKYGMMVSWKCRFVMHPATSSYVLLKDIAGNCSMTIFTSAGFDLLTLSCSREKAGQTHPLWGKIYYHCGYRMSLNCCHKCLISAYSCFYRNISSAGAQQMMFPGVCTTLPLQQKPCVTPDFILVNSGLKRWYRRSQIYNHKTAEHIGS